VSTRLGVSTTPVREAFALLQAEGFVRLDPYKGAIVLRPSAQEVSELYEIRQALEGLAIELAARNMADEELLELQHIVDRMRKTDDNERWLALNHEFHKRIYEASGRARLCMLIGNLRDASSSYLHMFLSNADKSRADDEHQEILNACRARDSRRACEILARHLRYTLDVVLHFLNASAETAKAESELATAPHTDATQVG
jgi:DNA-binding GntR family transcriptional regulator